jgi:SecD/SecF fusion protein
MWKLINEGVNREAKLQKVSNFDPQVAGDTQRDALLATLVSIALIMIYIWFRFGDMRFATATVVALVHDTLVVIGAIGLSHYLDNGFGHLLMIEPFRINLTLVAAILTVMGYSMLDTIVVFDRIRENRGRYGTVTRKVINDSVNQTLSRTLLTAGTTIVMVAVMYICGGAGIHGFTFVLLVGILFGTYSSIAIASPILLLHGRGKGARPEPPQTGSGNVRRGPVGQAQRLGAPADVTSVSVNRAKPA